MRVSSRSCGPDPDTKTIAGTRPSTASDCDEGTVSVPASACPSGCSMRTSRASYGNGGLGSCGRRNAPARAPGCTSNRIGALKPACWKVPSSAVTAASVFSPSLVVRLMVAVAPAGSRTVKPASVRSTETGKSRTPCTRMSIEPHHPCRPSPSARRMGSFWVPTSRVAAKTRESATSETMSMRFKVKLACGAASRRPRSDIRIWPETDASPSASVASKRTDSPCDSRVNASERPFATTSIAALPSAPAGRLQSSTIGPASGPASGLRTTATTGSSISAAPSAPSIRAVPIHAPIHAGSSGARAAGAGSAGVAAGGAMIPRRGDASCARAGWHAIAAMAAGIASA
jgi:hypothetical protein